MLNLALSVLALVLLLALAPFIGTLCIPSPRSDVAVVLIL